MRIDKNTVWFVASCKAPNIISFSDDTPDYIKDWFKEHRPNLALSDEESKDPLIPLNMERWPTPDELQDDVIYFYFTNTNYRNTVRFVEGNKDWIISEGKHEGLISSSDWITVQEQLAQNSSKSDGILTEMPICISASPLTEMPFSLSS